MYSTKVHSLHKRGPQGKNKAMVGHEEQPQVIWRDPLVPASSARGS